MTPQLHRTLCDHAVGDYRILTTLAADLLTAAAQRNLPQLDIFTQPDAPAQRRNAAR